jgi:hypothetical protein
MKAIKSMRFLMNSLMKSRRFERRCVNIHGEPSMFYTEEALGVNFHFLWLEWYDSIRGAREFFRRNP